MFDARAALAAEQNRLATRLLSHPFLQRCRNGHVSLEELKVLLVQQGHYSAFFTRYLCAMMANLPSSTEVLALAENLFEELGLAPDSPVPHYVIYREMLDAFGLSLASEAPADGTRQLIDTMFDYCRRHDSAQGLGALCLGAEALVPLFYADLIKGFEAHGVSPHTIRFFHLHVACDDGHAETISNLLEERIMQDPSRLGLIAAAGDALVDARCAFLDSIEAAGRAGSGAARAQQPAALAVTEPQ